MNGPAFAQDPAGEPATAAASGPPGPSGYPSEGQPGSGDLSASEQARAAVLASLRAAVRPAATASVSKPQFGDGAWAAAVTAFVAELNRYGHEVRAQGARDAGAEAMAECPQPDCHLTCDGYCVAKTRASDGAAGDVEHSRIVDQPPPVPNQRTSIQALVRADLDERERVGIQRYGTPLQPFNGRDALVDAYQEALDLACYLRQAIEERGRPTRESGPPVNADPMPVFVIKAKDALAVDAVSSYGALCVDAGLTAQSREVAKALTEIVSWRGRHRDQVQLPDHPHVPAGGTR